ncbi:response regulator [Marichromatium bheemlicum]|nr:response regulator [Marichromatium bheemlicum]
MAAFSTLLWWIQEQRLDELVSAEVDETAAVFGAVLEDQSRWLETLAASVAMDATTRNALATRNITQLDQHWRAMFKRLRRHNGITHVYFLDPGRRVLLRLHAPQRAGDRIDRFTTRQAERTDAAAQGLELGPLGTFTLRAVHPVRLQGERIGYVEVGKEIEDILDALQLPSEVGLAVLIRKHRLEPEQWRSGMRMLGRGDDWGRLQRSVVSYSSAGGLPPGLEAMIDDLDRPGVRHLDTGHERVIDGIRWRLALIPLHDAAGRAVGDLLLLHDLTHEAAAFDRHIRTWAIVTTLLLGLALGISLLLVRRTNRLIQRQQRSLLEHQGLLAATLRSIAEGVISTDAQGRVVDLNPTGAQLTGWQPSTAQGRHLTEVLTLLAPDSRDPIELPGAETLETRTTHALLIARDGKSWPVVVSSAPIRNETGRPLGAVIVFRDMTEEQRVHSELELSRERYMLAIDNSSDGIWDWDLRNDQVFISPRWKQQLGFADDELADRFESFESRLHPDEKRHVLDQLARYLQHAKQSYALEFRLRHRDGSYRWILSRGRALRNAQGQPYRMSGSHTDITARKEAERTMTMLSAAVEHSDDLVAIRDQALRVIAANPAFAHAVGAADTAQVVGRTDAELLGLDPEQDPVRATMADDRQAQSLPPGESLIREHTVRLASGETRTLLTKKYPIYDREQRLIGSGTLSIDISARKRAEDALRESNAALQTAIERAKMASRAKSRFLSNMSHEIRTPMNGVIGMLGLLRESPLDAEQQRYLEIAQHSGEGLLKIINDILDFSKIEAGKLTLEQLDFDLIELLDDFVATMALHAHDKGLELICGAAPEVPSTLRGDPGRILQILTNLVGNAIKFTEHGEVVVRVSLLDQEAGRVRLRLAVRDTGIGIARDKRQLLFRGFSQVDPSDSRRYGGTGLGLAITKQLVELMGGELGFESTVNQGSIFWCDLPFACQSASPGAPVTASARLRRQRILIVDDNRTSRELIAAQLSDWGLQTGLAGDGEQGLEQLRQGVRQEQPFTIALIDLGMPGMDGIALGETIRGEPALAATALVMLTALGRVRDTRRCSRHGFTTHLSKPIRHRDLLATLEAALAPAETTPPTPSPAAARDRHPARLLLADDNLTNQQVALGILGHLGFDADCVSNGQEVLDALASRHYDLLLIDVQMPLLDGLETTRRIRDPANDLPGREIPIIAMTAHALEDDRIRCLNAGMNDYLAKPIEPGTLAATLERWLPQPGAGLDTATLLEQLMGDTALVAQVIETFLADLPERLGELTRAHQQHDLPTCTRLARHITEAALGVGARQLQQAATALEAACSTGAATALISARLSAVETAFHDLRMALIEMRDTLPQDDDHVS